MLGTHVGGFGVARTYLYLNCGVHENDRNVFKSQYVIILKKAKTETYFTVFYDLINLFRIFSRVHLSYFIKTL